MFAAVIPILYTAVIHRTCFSIISHAYFDTSRALVPFTCVNSDAKRYGWFNFTSSDPPRSLPDAFAFPRPPTSAPTRHTTPHTHFAGRTRAHLSQSTRTHLHGNTLTKPPSPLSRCLEYLSSRPLASSPSSSEPPKVRKHYAVTADPLPPCLEHRNPAWAPDSSGRSTSRSASPTQSVQASLESANRSRARPSVASPRPRRYQHAEMRWTSSRSA